MTAGNLAAGRENAKDWSLTMSLKGTELESHSAKCMARLNENIFSMTHGF
jgi:hypothetical protein